MGKRALSIVLSLTGHSCLCARENPSLCACHHTCCGFLMWHLCGSKPGLTAGLTAAHVMHKHRLPASMMEQDGTGPRARVALSPAVLSIMLYPGRTLESSRSRVWLGLT